MPIRLPHVRLAGCLLAGALAVTLAAPGARAADWSTWGNSPARTGKATSSSINAGNAGLLRRAWSAPLGAVVDGQPLYAAGIQARGGTRSLYLVATEAGSVLALDARTGAQIWRDELGAVHLHCSQLPGGSYGVTGAMTYDPSLQTLYVVADNRMWALDVRDGSAEAGWPVTLPFDPQQLHAWGALAQHGTSVYVPTASYCDHPPFKGGVVRVDVATRSSSPWYPVAVPGPSGGGSVWGWGGVAVDPASGDVWAATGNAIVGPGVATEHDGAAEALVDLTPDLSQVRALSQPPGIPPAGDYDFGATPVLFHPAGCPPLVAALDKNGSIYLWRRDQLARGPVQRIVVALPATLFGVPAWNAAANSLYLTTTNGYGGYRSGLQAFRIQPGCTLRHTWTRGLGATLDSAPTIVNNTIAVTTGTGHLRIFDLTGRRLLDESLGKPMFVPPIAVGGDIAVTGWTRSLTVYRLPGARP